MNLVFSPASPLGFLEFHARHRVARLRESPRDLGASAVEWVVISAIVVIIVIAVGALLQNALTDKAGSIGDQIKDAGPGGGGGGGGGGNP